jgi:hypothetical protein
MLIDGGASVNILPLSLFKKLGHVEGDLKHTNLSLSGFAGAYDILRVGREGKLQYATQMGLDTRQQVCPVYSSSMRNLMDR